MQEYEVGKLYPMTVEDGNAILRQMGIMALMAKGIPDETRGRRYLGKSPDKWEFWMTSGQKVDFSVSLTGNMSCDHFIASVSQKSDKHRPIPQFEYVPTECIKPGCYNLVAPIGTEPISGHFKNYRATGACQKGHNGYHCQKCNAPHSYVSNVGKKHLKSNCGSSETKLTGKLNGMKQLKLI